MQYIAFDIECAQCQQRDFSPICSFGYARFNEKFELIDSEDIIINPDARFDQRIIKPAYKLSSYYSADKFPKHYEKIKSLLTAFDTIPLAFNAGSDMKYLRNECHRYSLDVIKTIWPIDMEDFIRLYEEQDSVGHYSLSNICERLLIPVTGEHNSEQDAYRTGLCMFEIMKGFKEKFGVSFQEVEKIIKAKKGREGLIRVIKCSKEQMLKKPALHSHDNIYSGQTICASHSIEDSKRFNRLAKKMGDINCYYSPLIKEADIFLMLKNDPDPLRPKIAKEMGAKIVLFETFMQQG